MTLVEKMARAIDSACECRNCGLLTYWENHSQECCDRPSWISASDRNKAIAALKALREPTESMEDAADEPFHDEWKSQRDMCTARGVPMGLASAGFSGRIWKAMIDQAIKEGE